MKKRQGQIPTALQFFGYRYPPFADTFEIHTPYLSDAEELMLQRTIALVRQGKSVAIHGEAGIGKSMLVKSITAQLDAKEFRIAQIPPTRQSRNQKGKNIRGISYKPNRNHTPT